MPAWASVAQSLRHGTMVVVIDRPTAGPFAEQNLSIARGATVAVDEINASGGLTDGTRIRLQEQDLDGLATGALETRLRADAAAVLILPCDTNSQLPLAAAAARFGMLTLAPCDPDPKAGGRYANYWPVGTSATDEGDALADYLQSFAEKNVFVVNSPGVSDVALQTQAFESAAAHRGIHIVGRASVATSTTNFSSVVEAIRGAQPSPNILFTAIPPPSVNRLAAAVHSAGIIVQVLGGSALDTPSALAGDDSGLVNAIVASYGFARKTAQSRRFVADYEAHFHTRPVGSFPGLGYEAIRLIQAAGKAGRSPQPAAMAHALSKGIKLEGVALAERTYQGAVDHNVVGPISVEKVIPGGFYPLVAVTASGTPVPPPPPTCEQELRNEARMSTEQRVSLERKGIPTTGCG